MLHTKYQGIKPYGFRQEDFGRGSLGDATYQISCLNT